MKNKIFWRWKNQASEQEERVLELYGTIAEESWFDDDVTPQMFRNELFSGKGPITLWINFTGWRLHCRKSDLYHVDGLSQMR